ncbi:MAG TPA: hypothetical protein ENN90_15675, partial [Mariniphaga anaerophila]|nr:hypothetical protein [Mariniphaga anaerophila]
MKSVKPKNMYSETTSSAVTFVKLIKSNHVIFPDKFLLLQILRGAAAGFEADISNTLKEILKIGWYSLLVVAVAIEVDIEIIRSLKLHILSISERRIGQ